MVFLNVATSAPAAVIATLLTDSVRGIARVFSAIARHRRYARAEAQLAAMTDRELEDIGISRGDIHARVWTGRFGR